MTTARDLCTQALKGCGVLGVGQTPLAEDINDTFTALRQMLAQWQQRRWLVPSLQNISAVGNNSASNTVGPGQYFDVSPRPTQIKYAFVRLLTPQPPNQVDYYLAPLASYEDYDKITLKQLNSFPAYYFYDNQYPVGNIFVWPIPSSQYRIFITVQSALNIPTSVNSDMIFPPEYEEAIVCNLIIRLCTLVYDRAVPAGVVQLAKVALNTIKNNNAQISNLVSPFSTGNSYGYNIYSDTGA